MTYSSVKRSAVEKLYEFKDMRLDRRLWNVFRAGGLESDVLVPVDGFTGLVLRMGLDKPIGFDEAKRFLVQFPYYAVLKS